MITLRYLCFFTGIGLIAYAYFTNAEYQGLLEVIGGLVILVSGAEINFKRKR